MGPLISLFWTSGDVCPGFQSQSGFPHLHASSPVHNGFLRFTSGATPTDPLADSMVAELLWLSPYVKTLVGSQSRIEHAAAS